MELKPIAIAAVSIFLVFKLRSTLKELQNAVKLLQQSTERLLSTENKTVDVAEDDVITAKTGNTASEVAAVTPEADVINKIIRTDDTANKIAHDVSAIMSKIVRTDEGVSRIENILELMGRNSKKTYDTVSTLPITVNATAENVTKLDDMFQLMEHNSKKTYDTVSTLPTTIDISVSKLQNAIELMGQKTYDTVSTLPTTMDETAKKYSMYLHNEHAEIMSAISKK